MSTTPFHKTVSDQIARTLKTSQPDKDEKIEQFNVRLDRLLVTKLNVLSEKSNISRNKLIVGLLEEACNEVMSRLDQETRDVIEARSNIS